MQKTGLKRNTNDKYYTSKEGVDFCIKIFKENIELNNNDLCIEPSAGNGSFINSIKTIFNHHKFFDIEPDHSDILKQDYLLYEYNSDPKDTVNKVHR